jgi:hypothetical protein
MRLYDRFDDNGKVRRNRFWGNQSLGMGEVNRRVAGAGKVASSCENVNLGACLVPLKREGWWRGGLVCGVFWCFVV